MESEDSVELLLEIPVETISDGEFPDQEEGELDESLSDIRYCIKSVLLCARAIATYYTVLHLALSESKHKKGHVIDTFWL